MPEFKPDFMKFLESSPEVLGNLLKIAQEWEKLQGEIPDAPPASGPDEFEIGGKAEIRTVGISNEEVDAVTKSYAEAEVKEKAMQYVKGFIAGIMFVA